MIRRIVLSNFMAHAKTELRLADGLTVLVGPNNIGKSTVAVALKILARNTNSNFVMQHEQKECSISVETSEGHSIQWIKRKSPSYVINGQPKDRLGRGGTPPELDETLRLAAVEFEDKDFEPHFGDQKSPIFLINRPPSQIAQFFSTTSDAEKLVAIQRLHQRNRSEAQTQTKLLSSRNEALQLSLETLASIPKLEAEFVSLELEAQSLDSLANEIANLERLIRNFAESTLEQQMELHRTNCLLQLRPVPVIHPTEHLAGVAAEWEITAESHCFAHESSRVLAILTTVPVFVDDIPLSNMTTDLEFAIAKFTYYGERSLAHQDLALPCKWEATDTLQTLVVGIKTLEIENHRLAEIGRAAADLREFPTFVPEEPLGGTIRQFDQATRDCMRLDALLTLLKPIAPTPPVTDSNPLNETIASVEKTTEQFTKYRSLLVQVQEEMGSLETETEQWLTTEPKCNMCGGKLSVESIRFKMHRHGTKS